MSEEPEPALGHYARTLTSSETEKLAKDVNLVSPFKQNKLENEAKKNWDLFYKRNETRSYKDRHWTKREFEELVSENSDPNQTIASIPNSTKRTLLEVGCGVGNFALPLIEEGTDFYIYACDFSPRAIKFLQQNPIFTENAGKTFVCDLTSDDLRDNVPQNGVDVVTMIFVLSAIHPDKMVKVLKNIYCVTRPGGVLLFRDYGLFDQAMLRFAPGHKLDENFYVRQDGTRAFYFSENHLKNIVEEAGFVVKSNKYVQRETVNKKEGICVPRIFIQGKFQKPSDSS